MAHPPTALPAPAYSEICERATRAGLNVRGAYHPAHDDELLKAAAFDVATFVMLGFAGGELWPHFASAPEARDGLPAPLDRWSRRVIGALAHGYGATAVYPSGEPLLPFQRLAVRCEPVNPSPIGLLIHPRWGLWHAYRGALLFVERIDLPTAIVAEAPCSTCLAQPCLSACPVTAFRDGVYDVAACVAHVESEEGSECRERGCLARRACPVGPEARYSLEQAKFHMDAFRRSMAR